MLLSSQNAGVRDVRVKPSSYTLGHRNDIMESETFQPSIAPLSVKDSDVFQEKTPNSGRKRAFEEVS